MKTTINTTDQNKLKIAVLGAGISGLGAAYLLSKKHTVDVYEKENRLGGHARTSMVKEGTQSFGVDTGFLVFNHATYPLLTKLFEELDVKIEKSNMSFGFWNESLDYAYNGESLAGMFFQHKNIFSLNHYTMIFDILRFNKQANKDVENKDFDEEENLGDYLKSYSEVFKERYILPMGAAIWSTPTNKMHDFPAKTFLRFFKNHGLLGVDTQHQWLTVSGGSKNYVEKIKKNISGSIFYNSDVINIQRFEKEIVLIHEDGQQTHYDKVILAMHAPDALKILDNPSKEEAHILSSFQYKENKAVLHTDNAMLYPNKKVYAAWNYKTNQSNQEITLSYYINRLQNIPSKKDYFVSLNETSKINDTIEEVNYEHPQFDRLAIEAQKRHNEINGKNNTYYAGAYWRYGFHEDGLYSANIIAKKYGCAL